MATENLGIEDLILLHLKDEISEEQKATLNKWRSQSKENEQLFSELTDRETLHRLLTSFQEIARSGKQKQKVIKLVSPKTLR